MQTFNLDPWTSLRLGLVQLRIPPTFPPSSLERALSLPVTVVHHDVQSLIDSVPLSVATPAAPPGKLGHPSKDMSFFQGYHTWDEITNFTRSLAVKYSDIVELISVGETFEGREILGVRIFGGKKKGKNKDGKGYRRTRNKGKLGRKHYRKGKAHGNRVYLPEEGMFRELHEEIREVLGLDTVESASFSGESVLVENKDEDHEDDSDENGDDSDYSDDEDDDDDDDDEADDEEEEEETEEVDDNEEELQEAEEGEEAGSNRRHGKLRFVRSRKLKSKGKRRTKEIILNGGQHARGRFLDIKLA